MKGKVELEFGIESSQYFKKFINQVLQNGEDVMLNFNDDGLNIRCMDADQVCMVDAHIPKSNMEKYFVEEGYAHIDIGEMDRYLKNLKKEDKIHMIIAEDKMSVTLRGSAERKKNFLIMGDISNSLKLPQIEFTSEIKLYPKLLKELLKEHLTQSNQVTFKTDYNDERVILTSKCDTGDLETKIPYDGYLGCEARAKSEATYTIEHLLKMVKNLDVPSFATIEYRTDAPMKLSYAIGEFRIIEYLAPRVEST